MDKFTIGAICVVLAILAIPLMISYMSPKEVAAPAPTPIPARPSEVAAAPVQASAPAPGAAPMVVSSTPPIGAVSVDPKLTEIRVTFNMPMAGGFSWTGGGANFPSGPSGAKPYWLPDKTTCVLPVTLKPNFSYRFGLNSPSHKNFRGANGVPLTPLQFTFSTAGG